MQTKPPFSPATSLLITCTLTGVTLSGAAQASAAVKESDMQRYCQGEAAAAFQLSPRDILTLPVERDNKGYLVYGQSPAEGSNALFFKCRFDEQRKFVKVKKESDSRRGTAGGSGSGSDRVAVADMPRYCAGEASAKFNQRPRDISTQKPIKEQGMYSVFGQFPPSGADPTIFICTFSAEGKLVGVDKQESQGGSSPGMSDTGGFKLQGRTRGQCKLTNTAAELELYNGNCTIKEKISGSSTTFEIKMGHGDPFKFVSSDGVNWMYGPERVKFHDRGDSAVFRWGKFLLSVHEN